MKRYFLLLLSLAALLGNERAARAQTGPDDDVGHLATVTLHVGKAALTTEVAATGPQQERGLMWRTHLDDNAGMIFLLPAPQTAQFWMEHCVIPLSVAYIDKNGVILEIHDMAAPAPSVPDRDLPLYRSDSDQIAYALEANLHWFALNGVKPGDKIDPAPATLSPSNLSSQRPEKIK